MQAGISVTQARAQADAVRLAAQAEAIKLRGDALKDNPGLVWLTRPEKWPRTMLPGGSVPMLNLNAN